MKRLYAVLLVLCLTVLAGCVPSGQVLTPAPSAPGGQPPSLAFVHVTVIDATGTPAQPDMTVVIVGDRIADVGQADAVRVPDQVQVVDATGKFLIPGLWDMHVHCYDKEYLPLFTANGVTGVRQMFGIPAHLQWRQQSANDPTIPRMVIASPIVDGPHPIQPGSIGVSNEAEARQAVITIKEGGWDFVKVYSLIPRDAYFSIADEAKKQGIPFAGHVPLSVSAAEASDAGQKSMEHLTGILLACSTREAELRAEMGQVSTAMEMMRAERQGLDTYSDQKTVALFARFVRNGTWQCPTLVVLRNIAYLDDEPLASDPRLGYMPASVRSMWNPKTGTWQSMTADDYADAKRAYQKDLEIVGAMRRAGVEFLAGTDTPNPYCFPGFSLHDELALLVRAGLTPMEALQAATCNPAEFLDTLDSIGTIEKGKLADLVLLDADPLQDIGHTQQIRAVVVGGRLLDRKALDEMLAQVEALAR